MRNADFMLALRKKYVIIQTSAGNKALSFLVQP